ncbi:MAG: GFA family protein [Candidatus Binataceae bacterium]
MADAYAERCITRLRALRCSRSNATGATVQRASGTGHVPVMGVAKASFEVRGETKGYTVRGGGLNSTRHFCPACGSPLFGISEIAPRTVSIHVGTLDDPSVFKPPHRSPDSFALAPAFSVN